MRRFIFGIFVAIVALSSLPHAAHAADGEFSLQVTPAPLTTLIKPGQSATTEVKIRNLGQSAEELKIEPRSFTFNSTTQSIEIDDGMPPDIADWIGFSSPTFTIQPGQWFTQKVHISIPKDAGFSYSFVLLISRANEPSVDAGRSLKGSVAIFSLINVDRPDAVRKLEVTSFSATKGIFEKLPVDLTLRVKNTGNTIAQPAGNIFIQRDVASNSPISVLPLNEKGGFILPGTEREFKTSWNDGFNGDWRNIANLRFGSYAAKAVMVYDDGQRDVSMEKHVSFWVIPWTILFVGILLVSLVAFGAWSVVSKLAKASKRSKPIRFDRRP